MKSLHQRVETRSVRPALIGRLVITAVMFRAHRKRPTAEFLASIGASRYESFLFSCPRLTKSAIPLGMQAGGGCGGRGGMVWAVEGRGNLARDGAGEREEKGRGRGWKTWRWLSKSRWAGGSGGGAVHIRPEDSSTRDERNTSKRVKPGQARKRLDSLFPSHHPVLPLFISASLHLRECLFVFLFFKSSFQLREEPKTSKTSTAEVFLCVSSREKFHTHMLSTAPCTPARPLPALNRGGGPPTLPMRNPHSTREPKSPRVPEQLKLWEGSTAGVRKPHPDLGLWILLIQRLSVCKSADLSFGNRS